MKLIFQFAIVATADDYWTISNFSDTENCFDHTLAQVTARNLRETLAFLDLIEAKGMKF